MEVTDAEGEHRPLVSQAFCSALPVAYTRVPASHWKAFASLVLQAAYEATMWAAALNAQRGASKVVLLTRLGGGAFGNDDGWIHAAMRRALKMMSGIDIDVKLVSYGGAVASNPTNGRRISLLMTQHEKSNASRARGEQLHRPGLLSDPRRWRQRTCGVCTAALADAGGLRRPASPPSFVPGCSRRGWAFRRTPPRKCNIEASLMRALCFPAHAWMLPSVTTIASPPQMPPPMRA